MREQIDALALTVWPTLISPPVTADKLLDNRDPRAPDLLPKPAPGTSTYCTTKSCATSPRPASSARFPNTVLINEGDHADSMFIMLSGACASIRATTQDVNSSSTSTALASMSARFARRLAALGVGQHRRADDVRGGEPHAGPRLPARASGLRQHLIQQADPPLRATPKLEEPGAVGCLRPARAAARHARVPSEAGCRRARAAHAAGHRRSRRRVARHDQQAPQGPGRRRLPVGERRTITLHKKLPSGW